MSVLALSDELLSEYLNFRFQRAFNESLVEKLFKFIQPALVAPAQHPVFSDPAALGQFAGDPVINLVAVPDGVNDVSAYLVSKTRLKLQLVTQKDSKKSYAQLNVLAVGLGFERLNMLLSGSYQAGGQKQEALSHIKALLSDAESITITDRYLAQENNWQQCREVLSEVLPRTSIRVTLISERFNRHTELEELCSQWKVKARQIGRSVHDRYIETDRLQILLSSGLFHLSVKSNTDLTYVVKIKS